MVLVLCFAIQVLSRAKYFQPLPAAAHSVTWPLSLVNLNSHGEISEDQIFCFIALKCYCCLLWVCGPYRQCNNGLTNNFSKSILLIAVSVQLILHFNIEDKLYGFKHFLEDLTNASFATQATEYLNMFHRLLLFFWYLCVNNRMLWSYTNRNYRKINQKRWRQNATHWPSREKKQNITLTWEKTQTVKYNSVKVQCYRIEVNVAFGLY